MSPADLRALAQEPALAAMGRTPGEAETPSVTQADLDEALRRLGEGAPRTPGPPTSEPMRRPIEPSVTKS